jgi:HEAT repeat protein
MTANPRTYRTISIFIGFFSAIMFLPVCGCDPGTSAYTLVDTSGSTVGVDLETRAVQIIRQGLIDDNPQVRTNAVEIAAAAGDKEFMPYVESLLADEYVPVRFAAAVAIGDARYETAGSKVAKLLKDDDENVRIAASYALNRISNQGASRELLAAIKSSDLRVRANAALLLGKTGDRRVLPLLYDAMNDEASDDRVRLNSVEAIARLGDEKIYQKLWAMLISVYADDRVFGIQAMSGLGTGPAKDAIETMLRDDLPEVRLVAAEQLGRLGDTEGEKVVLDALTVNAASAGDAEERVRIQTLAASAIGQIRTAALRKNLPDLLKNESVIVRLAAAKAVLQCASRDNIGR